MLDLSCNNDKDNKDTIDIDQFRAILSEKIDLHTLLCVESTDYAIDEAFEYARHYSQIRYEDGLRKEIISLKLNGCINGVANVRYSMSSVLAAYSENTCAVSLEIVSNNGLFVCNREFVKELYDFCKKRDILFIVKDEFFAMGKCGFRFAVEAYDVMPDVFILGHKEHAFLCFGSCINKVSLPQIEMANRCETVSITRFSPNDLLEVQGKSYYFKIYLSRIRNVTRVENLGVMYLFATKKSASYICKKCLEKGLIITDFKNKLGLFLPINCAKQDMDQTIRILNSVISE